MIHPKRIVAHPVLFRRGFTLVELLTVIAVIGVLAAITIPTIGKMRASATATKCLSNLRQIGNAATLYAQDNKGAALPTRVNSSFTDHPYRDRNFGPIVYLIATTRAGTENAPDLGAGADYAKDGRFFYMCPGADIPVTHRAWGNYVTHPVIMRKVSSTADYYRLNNVARPAKVIMVADGAQDANGTCGVSGSPFDKTYSDALSNTSLDIELDKSNPDVDLGEIGWFRYRHNGRVNCLYVDGHVQANAKGSLTYANVIDSR